MKYLATIPLCLLLAGIATAAPPHQRVVLTNGLVVIAVQDNSTSIAAFHLAVRTNPADIPSDRAGLTAMVQQVLENSLGDLYEEKTWQPLREEVAAQGDFDLNTEADYSDISAQVTNGDLPVALRLAGKLFFGDQTYDEAQVAAARADLENSLQNDATRVIEDTYYRFLQALYGRTSPYARPVAGTEETLARISATDVNAYRHTFYAPGSASLCIIGPQSSAALISMARQALGAYHGGRKSTVGRPAALTSSRLAVGTEEGWEGASLMVGVPVPAYGTRDFVISQLIYMMLQGNQGRLRKDPDLRSNLGLNRLITPNDDSFAVTAMGPLPMPGPFLALHMVTAPRLMEKARQAMVRQFMAFASAAPGEAELKQAKTGLINSFATSQLDHEGFAKTLNCYEIYGADYTQAWRFDSLVDGIKPGDVMDFAKRDFKNRAIGVILPGDTEPAPNDMSED